MGSCGRPGRVTSAPAPPPPQPESRGFGGALSQAPVESTDSIERCSGLEREAKGIGAPGPRARLGRLGRGRRSPWAPRLGGRSPGGRTRAGATPMVRKGNACRAPAVWPAPCPGPIEHPDSSELPFRGAQANGTYTLVCCLPLPRCPGKATCIPKRLNNCVE
ncbi:hypothetical protein MJG53_013412 [Ovis ammon polii x Ovis aries]|uniref:Uncharacterized protein n=1 Tax=Ovis ammon polii x Ovis aries TaxID=2918886 RepID=A0ACB9UJE9_9CETA|nr:serine/threonine-protein kinase LMTK3-like [Ovis aries]KAI4571306.1 hypothetical protein MJG53_013412 [Ovis ammon polii x Ovis aries]